MSFVSKTIATLGAFSLVATPALAAPALQTSSSTRTALGAEMGGRVGSPSADSEKLNGGAGGIFIAIFAGAAIILGIVAATSHSSGRPKSP